ncbi:MAG: class I SAM-dependent methyltransferase [Planctomycetes bacterium]|nr:class I SAM-dependent methyltransferase [Planctomycetota bacterium]
MLSRVLEPEVMDTPEEALAYDTMDHSEVNRAFVTDFLAAAGSVSGEILDLGTGTALIPIEVCRRDSSARVRAIDLSANMLDLARANLELANLNERVTLERVDGKGLPYPDESFAAVMSNSIVHHIPEPHSVLAEAVRVVAGGGPIFIRDLLRPPDESTLQRLVAQYASASTDHQRQLFSDSLRAALTLDEVRALVAGLGFSLETVTQTSDRHWTWSARKA